MMTVLPDSILCETEIVYGCLWLRKFWDLVWDKVFGDDTTPSQICDWDKIVSKYGWWQYSQSDLWLRQSCV